MPRFAISGRTPLAQPAAIVRAAGRDEYVAIADLLLRANLEYRTVVPAAVFEAYMRDLSVLTQSWVDKDFLVAESDGKLVGAVAFYRDASAIGFDLPQEWAGLRALAVDPAVRGRGIGRHLTEACVLRAWRIGRAAICLHNAALQGAARKLYLSMGFAHCPQYDINTTDLFEVAGERIAIEAFCLDLRSAAA
jgi:GNAT superfamily N-acetyltransferase